MKPFLVLQLRPEHEASDDEFAAFLRAGNLAAEHTHRVRMEQDGLPSINLDDYAGVIMGGGPSNVSDPHHAKSSAQKRFEAQLTPLLQTIVSRDIPFLGACYGLGALATALGGEVSKERYGEEVGATTISLTNHAEHDPLTRDLPSTFRAFGGHKEACQDVPPGATLLASSATCPVQLIRVGANVYGTQFHPELDTAGLTLRIEVYRHAGYFPPEDADELIALAKYETITAPQVIMERFVTRYRTFQNS